ncbi:MAG TPA: AbrB/MazE/SpoVT family DNA-binding domain-containing protein [Acidobacteriota bacterium]
MSWESGSSYNISIVRDIVGGGVMAKSVVSTKYQVVIPKEIRKEIGLKSGQIVQVIAKNGVIALIPEQPLAQLRGFLKGMKTDRVRDKRDRP